MDASPHFLAGKKIVVAGAGVSGLAFAIALRKQWPAISDSNPPSIAIYERETRADLEGREGYSLSLRSDAPGGIQALQKLGILDEMAAAATVAVTAGSQSGFCIWDESWNSIMKTSAAIPAGLPVGVMRITRKELRAVLIAAARRWGCHITWNVACTGAQRTTDGQLAATLSDGSVAPCDLLIAADGSRSKIRQQLRPDDALVFRGISVVSAVARFADQPPKPLDRDWGMLINGTGIGLFASPVDTHSALWSLSWPSDTPCASKRAPLSSQDAAELMDRATAEAPRFPSLLGTLLDATDTSTLMAFNAEDKEPFAHHDPTWSDVVFVGDANHAVSPFAGNGANAALCDAWDLAQKLCASGSLGEAVRSYDELAVARSTQVWKRSHTNIQVGHSTGWRRWGYMLLLRIVGWWFFRGNASEPPASAART